MIVVQLICSIIITAIFAIIWLDRRKKGSYRSIASLFLFLGIATILFGVISSINS